MFDEEDDVVDFVLFQAFEFGDEIGSSVFVEVESTLVEFVDGWVVGFGVEDVVGDVVDDVFEVHVDRGTFGEVVTVVVEKLFEVAHGPSLFFLDLFVLHQWYLN